MKVKKLRSFRAVCASLSDAAACFLRAATRFFPCQVHTSLQTGAKQRTGKLSVSLVGSDGRVFGGGVAGILMTASPIQVVVGSFLLGPLKSDSSPLRLTQGNISGITTPPVAQRFSEPKSELRGSSGARPQEGHHTASASGQSSEQRPQAIGLEHCTTYSLFRGQPESRYQHIFGRWLKWIAN